MNGDVKDNSNGDKSIQRDHNTEGITTTTSHPSVQPSGNQEESTTNTKNKKNLESDPSSSCTPGRPPNRHSPSQSSGAPSCLSLLHKLCVGPATAKKIGGEKENGMTDESEGSGGEMMSVRGGSSSSRSGGRGVRSGVRPGTGAGTVGGGGGGGGSNSVRSGTSTGIGTGIGTGVGMEGLNRTVSCDKDKDKIEEKRKNTSSTDIKLISDIKADKKDGNTIQNESEKQKQKSDQENKQGKEQEEGQEKEDNDEELKDEFLPRNSTSSEQTIEINFTPSSSSSSTAMQLDFNNEIDVIQVTDFKNLSLNLPENHDNSPNSGSTTPIRISDCELSQKIGFIKQLEFIHKLTDMVDKLRSVDRAVRGEILCRGLKKLNERPSELGENSVFLHFFSCAYCSFYLRFFPSPFFFSSLTFTSFYPSILSFTNSLSFSLLFILTHFSPLLSSPLHSSPLLTLLS